MEWDRFFYLIINNSFRILPIIILCYIPFIQTLGNKAKSVIARISIAYLSVVIVYAAVLANIDIDINSDILNYSFMALSFFYFRKTINEGRQKINFIFFIGLHTGIVVAAIINTVYTFVMLIKQAEIPQSQYLIITLFFCVVIYPVIGLFIHRKIAPNLRWVNSRDMNWLWVIPVLFSVIQFAIFLVFYGTYTIGSYYSVQYNAFDLVNYVYPIFSVLFLFISFFVYFIVVKMLTSVGKNVRLEMEATLANEQKAAIERLNLLRVEMLQTISHEARTPLAVLSSYVNLITLEINEKYTDPQMTADLDKIVFEAKRVANLIDHLNDLPIQKENVIERHQLDMGELVLQTAQLYQHILQRVGVKLIAEIPDGLPHISGNPEELTQVVFNILQNAKVYTEEGSVKIKAGEENKRIWVSITDSGTGINPELLPRVFERGIYGKTGGSGIGLALCKEIIESHGGEIKIESELGEGTTVTFHLPSYDGDGEWIAKE